MASDFEVLIHSAWVWSEGQQDHIIGKKQMSFSFLSSFCFPKWPISHVEIVAHSSAFVQWAPL